MGRKDILKVEGVELTDEQVQKLALIAPLASVNIIRSYRVSEKKNAVLPTTMIGILSCTGDHLRLGPGEGLGPVGLLRS